MSSSAGIVPENSKAHADFERVQQVADAVLYEGYVLYPYRKSSGKNRVRWQFGVLAERGWVEADGPVMPEVAGSVETWRQQTECLFEVIDDPRLITLHVRLRYLQLQNKTVEQCDFEGNYRPVESAEVDGQQVLSFDEAVPHEFDLAVCLADLINEPRQFDVGVHGGEEVTELNATTRVVRRRWPISATTNLSVQRIDVPFPAYKFRIFTQNTGNSLEPHAPRDIALRTSMLATHTLLCGHGLAFSSLIEPTSWAAPFVSGCQNIHTFPVRIGEPGTHNLMLSSPILLYDYPEVAPESPGDMHDAAEIDDMLSLRTRTLTEEEKQEERANDPRVAQILDRVEKMPKEVFSRLHGTIRLPEQNSHRNSDQSVGKDNGNGKTSIPVSRSVSNPAAPSTTKEARDGCRERDANLDAGDDEFFGSFRSERSGHPVDLRRDEL